MFLKIIFIYSVSYLYNNFLSLQKIMSNIFSYFFVLKNKKLFLRIVNKWILYFFKPFWKTLPNRRYRPLDSQTRSKKFIWLPPSKQEWDLRVSGNCSFVGITSLASKRACLYILLCVVPGTTSCVQEKGHEYTRNCCKHQHWSHNFSPE